MIAVEPFTVRHTLASDGEAMASDGGPIGDGVAALAIMGPENWDAVERSGCVWTGLRNESIVAVCGVLQFWPGYGRLFAIFHNRCTPGDFVRIHRVADEKIRGFQREGMERIEAVVSCDFEEGQRWVRVLGFQWEGRLRRYLNGADANIFSRIKDDDGQ